jgi:dihydrofolate reductase
MGRKGHNRVYIATSLDGYIADADGGVGFLDTFPMPEHDDMGFAEFMGRTEAILMGRKSFETVLGFGVAWPYAKPVYVWTQTLQEIPESLSDKVTLVSGETIEVLERIHKEGYFELYIDGGLTIQSFLKHDLIDEITITTIPVLMGGGIPLFGPLKGMLTFGCVKSKSYGNGLSQNVYVRSRSDGLS